MTKITVGRMLGMVIEKKRRTAPAPSIAAASYRSRDTACMAASRIRALYPVHRQLTIDPIEWKRDRLASHFAIGSMVNWRWTGYNALILLAAMQAVSRDLYEAAAIDGAGAVRRFFSITIPSIRPTVIFVIVTATVYGLQIFAVPLLYD